MAPGDSQELSWQIPASVGGPIAEIGLQVRCENAARGRLYLDQLTWDGEPDAVWRRPGHGGLMWRRAWVDAVDHYFTHFEKTFRLEILGGGLRGRAEELCVVSAVDSKYQLADGGIALIVEEGCISVDEVQVRPSRQVAAVRVRHSRLP